ncbi:IclR family transcriptional regulator C-terminal domain-containing protein [Emcibacter sp. SYSU 3D8]|uniref:IclR family transcriptional regulator n=1 Tax=Emcibacter sp. SYSU 3D8 TaxID=3133969 RepID=UPI0031FE695D
MANAASQTSYQLQTVSRALETMRLLEGAGSPLSQTEIAAALGEPVPVVFRILHTLENHGFVSRLPDKRYSPKGAAEPDGMGLPLDILKLLAAAGPHGARRSQLASRLDAEPGQVDAALTVLAERKLASVSGQDVWSPGFGLLELARPLLRGSLRTAVRPLMERLRDESGETATLFVTSGRQQVVVDVAASREPLRYELEIGRSFDLPTGAAGKAALAAMADARIREILNEAALPATDQRRIMVEIGRVRETGFATSTGERIEGASAVAASIRDESGRARGVMGLMMPAFRNPPDRLQHLGKVIVSQLGKLRLPEDMGVSEPDGESI